MPRKSWFIFGEVEDIAMIGAGRKKDIIREGVALQTSRSLRVIGTSNVAIKREGNVITALERTVFNVTKRNPAGNFYT